MIALCVKDFQVGFILFDYWRYKLSTGVPLRLSTAVHEETLIDPADTQPIMTSERKPVVKSADMSDDMQQDAVECAIAVRSCKHACLCRSIVHRPSISVYCRL